MTDFTDQRDALLASIVESSRRSAEASERLTREIDACQDRLKTIRTRISERVAMKYALESLPSLIGQQDFKDLCLAIGIAEGEVVTGQDFASVVRDHVFTARRKAEQSREKLRQVGPF